MKPSLLSLAPGFFLLVLAPRPSLLLIPRSSLFDPRFPLLAPRFSLVLAPRSSLLISRSFLLASRFSLSSLIARFLLLAPCSTFLSLALALVLALALRSLTLAHSK